MTITSEDDMGHYRSDVGYSSHEAMGGKSLTDEFRKAADIEAATPITVSPSLISPELATAYAALIAHLRAEIDRQAVQLRAEQEHNRRLTGAATLYRSAAVRNGMLVYGYAEGGACPAREVCDSILGRSREETDRADALVLPAAS
jgi:hypothetical protein